MDSTGRVVSVRSGREWSDWSSELRMSGDELRWKFVSDSSVNGWGWRFTVYPIPPAAAPCDVLSDRALQSRPSIDLARCLLGKNFFLWWTLSLSLNSSNSVLLEVDKLNSKSTYDLTLLEN